MWKPNSALTDKKKPLLRSIAVFLLGVLLLLIAIGLTVWLGMTMNLRPNIAMALILASAGLILLLASFTVLPYLERSQEGDLASTAAGDRTASSGEKPGLVNTIIDRIRRL